MYACVLWQKVFSFFRINYLLHKQHKYIILIILDCIHLYRNSLAYIIKGMLSKYKSKIYYYLVFCSFIQDIVRKTENTQQKIGFSICHIIHTIAHLCNFSIYKQFLIKLLPNFTTRISAIILISFNVQHRISIFFLLEHAMECLIIFIKAIHTIRFQIISKCTVIS